MKKLFLLALILLTSAVIFACTPETSGHSLDDGWSYDADYHWKICTDEGCGVTAARGAHSWGDPSEGSGGALTYTCRICGLEKSEHDHVYSDDYTSNSSYHWRSCTIEGCTVTEEKSEHTFNDGIVVTPPTSEAEGTRQYRCEICGNTKNEPIEKLPEKMSRESWVKAFVYENVKIENTASIGGIGASSGTLLVDGDNAKQVSDSGDEIFCNPSDMLATIRFGDYYDQFSHNGEGVYYAENLTYRPATDYAAAYMEYLDCTITFDGETLTKIVYRMDTGIFGVITDTYIFSEWGMISIDAPKLTQKDLDDALEAENFEGNITVYKDETTSQTIRYTEINVIGDIYTSVVTDENGNIISSGYESSVGFAEALSAELRAIVDVIDTDSLIYDTYSGFIFDGEAELSDGSGDILTYAAIWLENDKISNFTYITENESGAEVRHLSYYIYYEGEI